MLNGRRVTSFAAPGEKIEERVLMPLVGIGELGHLLKRDPKAIRFAVSRGRITRRPDGLFHRDRALKEWEYNTLHERSHSAKKVLEIAAANDLPVENEKPAKASDYAKARAAAQIYDARLKRLKYEASQESCTGAGCSRCRLPDGELHQGSVPERSSASRRAARHRD